MGLEVDNSVMLNMDLESVRSSSSSTPSVANSSESAEEQVHSQPPQQLDQPQQEQHKHQHQHQHQEQFQDQPVHKSHAEKEISVVGVRKLISQSSGLKNNLAGLKSNLDEDLTSAAADPSEYNDDCKDLQERFATPIHRPIEKLSSSLRNPHTLRAFNDETSNNNLFPSSSILSQPSGPLFSNRRGSVTQGILDALKTATGFGANVDAIANELRSSSPSIMPVIEPSISRVQLQLTPPSSSRELSGRKSFGKLSIDSMSAAHDSKGDDHLGNDDSRRSSLNQAVSPVISSTKRTLGKFKAAARMIGLQKSIQNEQSDTIGDLPGSSPAAAAASSRSSKRASGSFGSLKVSASSLDHKEKQQEKLRQKKRQEAKHENLVDQLKLRKKTSQIKEFRDEDQTKKFQDYHREMERRRGRICGIYVWASNTRGVRYWEVLIACLVFFQVFLVPYSLVFQSETARNTFETVLETIDFLVDIIFLLDILLQFNITVQKGEKGYYGDEVEVIMDRKIIATTYFKSWFVIDVLAISPLLLLGLKGTINNLDSIKIVKVTRIPRLFRLLRIFRVMRTMNMKSKTMQFLMYSRYNNLLSFFSLIVVIMVIVHYYACMWYFISGEKTLERFVFFDDSYEPLWYQIDRFEEQSGENDDGKNLLDEDSIVVNNTTFVPVLETFDAYNEAYFHSIYQAVLLIMGESMDLTSKKERMWSIVGILVGAIVMALVFGEVSMSINNFSAANNLFRKKMTDLYESMEALGLPQNLQERIHLFYKYVWDEHHSIDGRPAILTFVPELSTNLAKEIYLYLFSDMITKVPMFHNRPADVVQHLVLAVQTLIYMPKDYVIVKGEFGSEMFFIQSGKCDVIIEMQRLKAQPPQLTQQGSRGGGRGANFRAIGQYIPGRKPSAIPRMKIDELHSGAIPKSEVEVIEKVVKELEKGDFFGEIALVTHGRRTASIRARTFTELIVLSREDFMRITENNREEREAMKEQIRQRYKDSGAKKALEDVKEKEAPSAEESKKGGDAANKKYSNKKGQGGSYGGSSKGPNADTDLSTNEESKAASGGEESKPSAFENRMKTLGSSKNLAKMNDELKDFNSGEREQPKRNRKKSFMEVHRNMRGGVIGGAGNQDKIDNELMELKLQIKSLQRGLLDVGVGMREMKDMVRYLVSEQREVNKERRESKTDESVEVEVEGKEEESEGESEEEDEKKDEEVGAAADDADVENGDNNREKETGQGDDTTGGNLPGAI